MAGWKGIAIDHLSDPRSLKKDSMCNVYTFIYAILIDLTGKYPIVSYIQRFVVSCRKLLYVYVRALCYPLLQMICIYVNC